MLDRAIIPVNREIKLHPSMPKRSSSPTKELSDLEKELKKVPELFSQFLDHTAVQEQTDILNSILDKAVCKNNAKADDAKKAFEKKILSASLCALIFIAGSFTTIYTWASRDYTHL